MNLFHQKIESNFWETFGFWGKFWTTFRILEQLLSNFFFWKFGATFWENWSNLGTVLLTALTLVCKPFHSARRVWSLSTSRFKMAESARRTRSGRQTRSQGRADIKSGKMSWESRLGTRLCRMHCSPVLVFSRTPALLCSPKHTSRAGVREGTGTGLNALHITYNYMLL